MVGFSTLAVTMLVLLPPIVSGKLLGKDEQAVMLSLHNSKRCMAGIDGLTWDDDLAKAASDYADTGPKGHSTALGAFSKYGECMQGSCPDDDPAKAMEFWYDKELPTYSGTGTAAHYTQVVWKGTKKVGCGYGPATGLGCKGKMYICQYLPPGNRGGHYQDNVIAPTKKESECPAKKSSGKASDAGDGDKAASSGKASDASDDAKGASKAGSFVKTKENCKCKEACGKHGESYTWCHTSDSCGGQPAKSAWDYCKVSRLFDETSIESNIISGDQHFSTVGVASLAVAGVALLALGVVVGRKTRGSYVAPENSDEEMLTNS